uniref:Transmembrane channel-like protein n=1 Tax=Ciona savignyi TaxID=51511 RepID=H2Z0I6_CIOSA
IVSFRRSYIVAREDDTNFISKVFCAWDFGITSKNTAELQHKIISTELKEILAEKHRHKQNRSFSKKVKFFFYRLLSWSLYLAITAGCLALIYFLNKALLSDLKTWVTMPLILRQLSLSLIVSTINLLIPILINLITHYENYKYPRHELYIAVFRNFVLKL